MIRPELKPGDIVKFSKKGKQANYPWPDNMTAVVTEVRGNGIDRSSLIYGRSIISGRAFTINAYRHHLWYTGKNIFGRPKVARVMNSRKRSL